MGRNFMVFPLMFMVFFIEFSSVSAKPPHAKIVSGIVSKVVSMLWKWLWSLQSIPTSTKSTVSGRSMMKFESGYTVETVFDGTKLGIEPYAAEVSPNGELLVLDSENSNIFRIPMPLSRHGRPKLVSGSPEGYTGHVDGKLKEARMNHPKGLTMDDRGNIYVADTDNMAIRKISDEGVTTIAGGKWRGSGGRGHVDGPSEDAEFSHDFDLVYVGSTCSLLIIDRGNQAIREIQLHDEDCSYEHNGDFHVGVAVLIAAVFFGYMLALLQCRVRSLFASCQNAPGKNPENFQFEDQHLYHIQQHQWPAQESFVIPDEDEPPCLEPRTGKPKKTDPRKQVIDNIQPCSNYTYNQYRHYKKQREFRQENLQSHRPSNPETCVGKNRETNEAVIDAVQDQDLRREAMEIKAADYGDHVHDQRNVRPRINHVGYSSHGC